MTEDIDPENPRPEGRYHVETVSTWYHVDDDLANVVDIDQSPTISTYFW